MYKNKQLFKFSTKNLSPTTEGFNAQATVGGQVNAIKSGNNTVVIGNSYLSRMFVTDSNGKLRTYQLKNSRANTTCTPASGSEEFIIQLSAKKKSWSIIGVDSEEKTSENGAASNILDGDISTIWHTRYNPTIDPYPHYIVIDLGAQTQISGFSYTPRQFGDNGNIKDYEFYISNDQNNFGTAVSKGTFQYKGVEPINVGFSTTVTGRYIKLIGKNAVNGQSFAACANIEILGPNTGSVKNDIKCSDLTLNDIVISNTEDDNGKIVKFYFKPFTFQEDIYTIVMNVVMKNDHHFMKKYLELKVDGFNTSINYIDLESLVLDSTVTQRWFRPEMEPAYISSYHIALGQPIYIQGMFLGCEFPQTDNRILNNVAFLRYFSGKKFKDLRKTSDGRYKTWKTVLGAARSTDMAVIQTDFFQYINTIAIKSDFRKQYNSWYDFMMNITSTNIVGSFYQ
ncbi:MAG: discoidin domain-containing protein, partial [Sarcina sp.]